MLLLAIFFSGKKQPQQWTKKNTPYWQIDSNIFLGFCSFMPSHFLQHFHRNRAALHKATQCKAKTNFYFSCQGFCHIQYFYLAISLPRKVKVCFRVAISSQPFWVLSHSASGNDVWKEIAHKCKQWLHYRLRGSIGKKSFFLDWPAFTHFWSNFDEIFCAGVKP